MSNIQRLLSVRMRLYVPLRIDVCEVPISLKFGTWKFFENTFSENWVFICYFAKISAYLFAGYLNLQMIVHKYYCFYLTEKIKGRKDTPIKTLKSTTPILKEFAHLNYHQNINVI